MVVSAGGKDNKYQIDNETTEILVSQGTDPSVVLLNDCSMQKEFECQMQRSIKPNNSANVCLLLSAKQNVLNISSQAIEKKIPPERKGGVTMKDKTSLQEYFKRPKAALPNGSLRALKGRRTHSSSIAAR